MTGDRQPSDRTSDSFDDGEELWKQMQKPAVEPMNLSFYAENERRVLRGYARALRRKSRRERLRRARSRVFGEGTRRFTRRTGTLAGLIAVTAATAYGASAIIGGSGSNGNGKTGAPGAGSAPSNVQLPVSSGRAGTDSWALRVWRRGSTICGGFAASELEQTGCGPVPIGDHVLTLRLESPANRYISGFAGAGVNSVRVTAGHTIVTVRTHPLDPRVHLAGLPAGERWFVAILHRGTAIREPRAHLVAITRPVR